MPPTVAPFATLGTDLDCPLASRPRRLSQSSFCRIAHKLIFFQAEQNRRTLGSSFLMARATCNPFIFGICEIENNQIGFQRLRFPDSVLAVRAFSTDLQVGTVFDHLTNSSSHPGVSIDDKDSW